VTITDPATVTKIAAVIDVLPVFPPGQATSMQQQVMAIAGIGWAGFPAG
jgi:hypothetical protein